AGKGRRTTPRNGCPAQPGSETVPRRAAVAYRECDAGVARRSVRGLVCDLRRAIADASALQRAGELYAARGIELAGAGRDGGALRGLRPAIRPRSGDSVDASGRDARAEEWPRRRTSPPRAARSGGRPNRGLFSPPGCRGSVCPDTQQAALRTTGIRPREHPSVLVECAPGRASRPGE